MGNVISTFETFNISPIESCLNSCAPYPLSNDPNGTLPLTPAHFLIEGLLLRSPSITGWILQFFSYLRVSKNLVAFLGHRIHISPTTTYQVTGTLP